MKILLLLKKEFMSVCSSLCLFVCLSVGLVVRLFVPQKMKNTKPVFLMRGQSRVTMRRKGERTKGNK